jgi:hypothetical protein
MAGGCVKAQNTTYAQLSQLSQTDLYTTCCGASGSQVQILGSPSGMSTWMCTLSRRHFAAAEKSQGKSKFLPNGVPKI